MTFKEAEFVPMLFGGDINTYSVARAFYEQYQVQSHVFGKYANGPSCGSKITIYHANEKIDTDEIFMKAVRTFCKRNSDKKVLTIGCGDSYVALISKHKDEFPENAIAPYIDFELMDSLQQKELFYSLCDKHGIDYPDTYIYHKEDYPSDGNVTAPVLEFSYPVILKPSNGINYWEHEFPTQEKVYLIPDEKKMREVIKDIYEAGYEDSLLIQDTIPGNDEYMRVLTSYSDRNGKVKMMCLGHVLLEEHTPHGKGNHAVIITEPQEELMEKVKALLEDLHYIGFSNFDIKYDSRDGKYKFFEINTRQGRSNYYVTGSGFNVAKYFVEEYIHGVDLPYETAKEEHLWLVVPKAVALKYVHDPLNKEKLERLLKEGKYVNPIFMKGEDSPVRNLRMLKQHYSHYNKYKKYYE